MLFSQILICRYVIFFRLDEILPATGRFSSSILASPFSEVKHYCQSKQIFHVLLWRLLFLRRNIATIDSPAGFSFTALASPFFKVRQYYQPQPIFICHFGVSLLYEARLFDFPDVLYDQMLSVGRSDNLYLPILSILRNIR